MEWKKKSMTPWQMLLNWTVSQLVYTLSIMLITHPFSQRDFRHYMWIIKSQLHIKLLSSKYYKYSWLPITRTLANSNQNRFPLDFHHTFTVILPSVTQTLDNSNLMLTQHNFCFPLDHFYTIIPLKTQTMF